MPSGPQIQKQSTLVLCLNEDETWSRKYTVHLEQFEDAQDACVIAVARLIQQTNRLRDATLRTFLRLADAPVPRLPRVRVGPSPRTPAGRRHGEQATQAGVGEASSNRGDPAPGRGQRPGSRLRRSRRTARGRADRADALARGVCRDGILIRRPPCPSASVIRQGGWRLLYPDGELSPPPVSPRSRASAPILRRRGGCDRAGPLLGQKGRWPKGTALWPCCSMNWASGFLAIVA